MPFSRGTMALTESGFVNEAKAESSCVAFTATQRTSTGGTSAARETGTRKFPKALSRESSSGYPASDLRSYYNRYRLAGVRQARSDQTSNATRAKNCVSHGSQFTLRFTSSLMRWRHIQEFPLRSKCGRSVWRAGRCGPPLRRTAGCDAAPATTAHSTFRSSDRCR